MFKNKTCEYNKNDQIPEPCTCIADTINWSWYCDENPQQKCSNF